MLLIEEHILPVYYQPSYNLSNFSEETNILCSPYDCEYQKRLLTLSKRKVWFYTTDSLVW